MSDTGILCPRCKQDSLGRWRLRDTSEVVLLCPECEAMWPDQTEPVLYQDFTDAVAFLTARGAPFISEQFVEP